MVQIFQNIKEMFLNLSAATLKATKFNGDGDGDRGSRRTGLFLVVRNECAVHLGHGFPYSRRYGAGGYHAVADIMLWRI